MTERCAFCDGLIYAEDLGKPGVGDEEDYLCSCFDDDWDYDWDDDDWDED
jgi:hypothetical protein